MSWLARTLDPEWPFDLLATDFSLRPDSAGLLVVDVQAGDLLIGPGTPMGTAYPAIAAHWNGRIERVVIPTIERLLAAFRSAGRPVTYTRVGYVTPSGTEMTERLRPRARPVSAYRGTPGYEIDARVAPRPEDVVVDKLTSGAFTGSFLDHALRNLGVEDLVVTGIVTDMCVLGTARAAAELGYRTVVCEDACTSYTERAHTEALLAHARTFGRVASAEDILAELAWLGGAAPMI